MRQTTSSAAGDVIPHLCFRGIRTSHRITAPPIWRCSAQHSCRSIMQSHHAVPSCRPIMQSHNVRRRLAGTEVRDLSSHADRYRACTTVHHREPPSASQQPARWHGVGRDPAAGTCPDCPAQRESYRRRPLQQPPLSRIGTVRTCSNRAPPSEPASGRGRRYQSAAALHGGGGSILRYTNPQKPQVVLIERIPEPPTRTRDVKPGTMNDLHLLQNSMRM